jgi:hypothetical protein
MLFSFYYTEKIALLMRQKDPIYETIEDVVSTSNTNYVNAIIDDKTIIPGMNGLAVNVDKSFQKMKSFGAFNKYYLIFDQVKPDISLEDNKDKIITKGNPKKRSIAFILEENESLKEYLIKENISASLLVTSSTFKRDSKLEQINADYKNYKSTEGLLDSIKQNKNICIVNNYNEEVCRKNQKYLIKPSLELNAYNLASIKNKLESGSIIYIKKEVKEDDLKLLIQQAKYKGLTITHLSELIKEDNNG